MRKICEGGWYWRIPGAEHQQHLVGIRLLARNKFAQRRRRKVAPWRGYVDMQLREDVYDWHVAIDRASIAIEFCQTTERTKTNRQCSGHPAR